MLDWLQTNAQLIGVVVGAVIAGTVAITVGALNNRASAARLEHQIRTEQQRESAKVKRERLEELHVLAGQWLMNLDNYTLLGLRLVSGRLSHSDYLKMQLDGGSAAGVQLTRMKMLLAIYAPPSVTDAHTTVEDARAAFNKEFFPVEGSYKGASRPQACPPELYDRIDDAAGNLHGAGERLLGAIAQAAAAI